MAYNCGVSFGLCMVRITRLASDGSVIAGSNAYVTDAPVSVTVTPNIETGNSFSVRNGCGCSISRRKFPDTFNWWEFSFNMAQLEPAMLAFMLGADTIVDGADTVGLAFVSALECDEAAPAVAFEFWTEHIVGSGRDGTYPYFHWVFPSTVWQVGDNTFEEGPAAPTFTGFSQTNTQWGDGPYGDGPPDGQDIREGGFWATNDALPTAECAPETVTATS